MLEAGDNVLICGDGPVMILAAKRALMCTDRPSRLQLAHTDLCQCPLLSLAVAAIKGYSTTCALAPRSLTEAPKLVYTDAHPEGSLPLSFLPIAGPDADSVVIDECVANSKGLIVAFDREVTMPEGALKGASSRAYHAFARTAD
jgi:hypothetical protein